MGLLRYAAPPHNSNVMHKNMNIEEFIKELMFTGNIIQDADKSIDFPERENRFNRYIELLDSVEGNEGIEAAMAIVRSIQAESDYGAYQTTQNTLGKFPSEIYIQALITELPALIQRKSDWAGELLCGLANSVETEYEEDIKIFNHSLSIASPETNAVISQYIKEQEEDGWLEHRAGVLNA